MFGINGHTQSTCQIHHVVDSRADFNQLDRHEQIGTDDQDKADPADQLKVFIVA